MSGTGPGSPQDRTLSHVVQGGAVLVLLLHAAAMMAPTGANWGFHFLAFLPVSLAGGILLISVLLLIPAVQRGVSDRVDEWGERWSSLPPVARRGGALFGVAGAIVLFWILRERVVLLGDGALAVRSLTEALDPSRISDLFRTAPLAGLAAWSIREGLTAVGMPASSELAWRILSIASGVAAILLFTGLAAEISGSRSSKILTFLLLVLSGTGQLFFGYVETYPLTFALSIAFFASALRLLRGRGGAIPVVTLFALLAFSHIAMLSFVPALLFLLAIGARRGEWRGILAGLITAGLTALIILRVTGFTPEKIAALGDLPGETRLPLLSSVGSGTPYGLLSIWHLTDLLNFVVLIFPFALPLLLFWKRIIPSMRGEVGIQFLLLAAAGGIAWLGSTHFTIGMSRDWDVAAVSATGWLILIAAVWARWGDGGKEARGLLIAVVGLTGLHTAAWVGTNAGQASGVTRFETLYTERLWTTQAGTYAFEDLSGFSRSRNDFFASVVYSAKALALDSTNPRRWLHFGGASALAGMDREAVESYSRGIASPQAQPGHFRDLARIQIRNERFADAISVLEAGLKRAPREPATLLMLAELYSADGVHGRRALELYAAAREIDPTIPGLEEKIERLKKAIGD